MENPNDAGLIFYPAYCFKASPTHFAWVKMALADVHRLQRRKGFEGQNVFFYKNHPITFISVVGVIVARTEITRRTILTIDDGSEATLDVIVLQAEPKEKNPTDTTFAPSSKSLSTGPSSNVTDISTEIPETPSLNETIHVSATDRTIINISSLQPGTMIKVKGTVNSFRSTMQMNLERFSIIHDTNAEMQFIDERLRFLVDVLSIPWVLTDEEVDALRIRALKDDFDLDEERKRAEKRGKRRLEMEERDQRYIQRKYEKEERKRAKVAGICKEDGVKIMRDIRKRRDFSSGFVG
ncbi:hypothetical protein N7450_002382 [Penicillium hetheringtonii]|uniref:CST complex subunit Stn1 N-terminal domain-containing protein n=1 Tax=Penicillium hetheringtonii TaxID=911720 RepID=A0AAD6DX94_9EURO|nr:hypothetical protein N7450_002382 [Penicillium hetheringtonii]